MNANPLAGLIGFWMVMQLIATLLLFAGGIYLLYSLGRAASGLERMADALEDWVMLQRSLQEQKKSTFSEEIRPSAPPPPPPSSPPLPDVPPAVRPDSPAVTEKENREHDSTEYP